MKLYGHFAEEIMRCSLWSVIIFHLVVMVFYNGALIFNALIDLNYLHMCTIVGVGYHNEE